MKFYSRKDTTHTIFIWGTIVLSMVISYISYTKDPENGLGTILVLLGVFLFLVWFWFGTFYTFKGDHIHARAGAISEKYYYEQITDIRRASNFSSSLALSKVRMAMYINGTVKGYISPKDEKGFLTELEKHMEIKDFGIYPEVMGNAN
ncbi:MAG: PH domain-containing protein [Clostridiaceae bacterium]